MKTQYLYSALSKCSAFASSAYLAYNTNKLLSDDFNISDIVGFVVVASIFSTQLEKKNFCYIVSGILAGSQFPYWIKRFSKGDEITGYNDDLYSTTSAMCSTEDDICAVNEINPFS